MKKLTLTHDQAEQVYDVLQEYCGAQNAIRDDFVRYATREYGPNETLEFRFCGELGLGGKFYSTSDGRWIVTCYSEDETVGKRSAITAANIELAVLRKRLLG